jgi:hypothetical protein
MWFRALVAIWGLWFTAVLSAAPGLHACAVHSGYAAASAHHTHATHAGHDVQSASRHESSSHDDASNHSSSGCTCLGISCCSAAVARPGHAIELPGGVIVSRREAPVANVANPVVRHAYTLPFANGPPAAQRRPSSN